MSQLPVTTRMATSFAQRPLQRTQPAMAQVQQPEIAVLVSSFQKPEHLRRVLLSLARQDLPTGQMEVIVTDDGSTDHSQAMVGSFANEMPFRLEFVTHAHDGFRLAQCRNEGVAASTAPYILFLDGDCIVEPDHVRQHLTHRQSGWAMAGYCYRLDEATSEAIDEKAIQAVSYPNVITKSDRKKLAKRHRKAIFYNWIRHRSKPKLAGGNVGIFREDYERVNGYNERFVGWGGEDDDLRMRLGKAGLRIGSILRWTQTYHLWHPPAESAAASYWECINVDKLHRPGKLTRCRDGLVKRSLHDLTYRFVSLPDDPALREVIAGRIQQETPYLLTAWRACECGQSGSEAAEVEIAFSTGQGRFSGKADCNLLFSPPGKFEEGSRNREARKRLRSAHLVCSETCPQGFQSSETHFDWNDFHAVFESIG